MNRPNCSDIADTQDCVLKARQGLCDEVFDSTSEPMSKYCAKTCSNCASRIKIQRIDSGCMNHRCQNGATCHPVNNIEYQCECVHGYRGIFCEAGQRNLACNGIVCLNNGLCVCNGVNQFSCVCTGNYSTTYFTTLFYFKFLNGLKRRLHWSILSD
jgi:hypothetical protein